MPTTAQRIAPHLPTGVKSRIALRPPVNAHFRLNPRHVPLESVLPTAHHQHRIGYGDECPNCHHAFAGGAIVADDPKPHLASGGFTKRLRMHCSSCNDLHQVIVSCNRTGTHINHVIHRGVIHGKSKDGQKIIDRFLREHPEALPVADVVQ